MGDLNLFCERMRHWCEVADLGYDQSNRWDIREGGECDCSSLVIFALREAGFDTGGATYTGNMSAELCARGWVRVAADGNPRKGDILLSDASHVAVWLGDRLAQASIDEDGNVAGGRAGDQSGRETNTRGYYDYPWDCYLRWPGAGHGGDAGRARKKMECIIRPDGASYLVYFDGSKAHPLEHPDEATAICEVYRKCTGADMPVFEYGSKKAPWAKRLFDGAGR